LWDGIRRLIARQLRQAGETARHAPLDAPQGHAHRGAQSLGCQQALGQVVDRAELQRPHCGEFVAFLGERDYRGSGGLFAEAAQQRQSVRG
jgi:hypothetical protein